MRVYESSVIQAAADLFRQLVIQQGPWLKLRSLQYGFSFQFCLAFL